MPELPEVETVRRGLAPHLEGKRITRADFRRPDLRWPFPTDIVARLEGQTIVRLGRRSKYLLADLSSGETLLVHLGMSGRLLLSGAGRDAPVQFADFALEHPAFEKHDHVVLDFEGGARLTFNDPRRFGAMDMIGRGQSGGHPLLAALGPEPLGNDFHAPYLIGRLRGRKTSAKAALLDQRIIAGLGNIYVCEALFRAGIAPTRQAGRIGKARIEALVPIVREVLTEAIASGGSSLRDFRQADGNIGYFQHRFNVYGREGEPCVKPDCAGQVRRVAQSGRSTFYCPVCQR
ncbi:bifunctional DNA-formamidopyrimidine glycosylase/DNA-(apurinic or apyrimidinic site) lyase [Qingshengfaniella alkalisoli]|uniref:Formamidopyrimidine-DNA glycosylase n=1 Tax=Qingshengfaniella alkalisoli TaxID=2599296 RepID=A0A5B8I8R4_9RHOB|nr:bifunctional DNA-formamidopyrimidine glycosylase/DNA-(apurinic or apyrimidinic site) lyase [Qingshengfaniella alkalisoli]QDY70169.1 bifunctional DNA-formamidopyrimidine glycosylase/DNA-(apurinic or apyrimidinic site) lyase [Qingshengfaniella alkalisoli]